jgi:hypothetical protein
MIYISIFTGFIYDTSFGFLAKENNISFQTTLRIEEMPIIRYRILKIVIKDVENSSNPK